MTWWMASLLSNVAIIMVEYINRTATGGFISVLPKTFLLIILAQFCLFRAFNGAPHWMIAWVVFAVGNSLMRVVSVNFMAGHEVANWYYTGGGCAVMMAGAYLVKSGMR